ncbi:Sentrin-specific protease 6, partial [Geodia barretti]
SVDEVEEFYSELDSRETVSLFSCTPTEDYEPSSSLRDIPMGDFVRRSTRIQNKDGERGKERERVMKILNEEGEEEEDGAVSYIPKGDPKKIILTYKPEGSRVNIEISEMDLDCLERGVYLNDRVIDFYLMYLWYDELGAGLRDRVHIFSSFFHQRLMDSTRDLTGTKELSVAKRLHDRVKSWTRHVDLFSKDYIILPVCVSSHWFLALICHPGQYKPPPPPTTRRRRKQRRPRQKVLCSTRSRAAKKEEEKKEEEGGRVTAATGIELISISYSQDDEEEEEGEEGEGKNDEEDEESPLRQDSDSSNGGADVAEDVGMNIHLTSCEEDETLVITGGEGEGGQGERDGEGEGEEMVLEMEEGDQKEEETNSISEETLEGDGEKEKTEREENKPCIMILDSLEIRRGAIVTRINNYLTEEWEVKKKDCSPVKFKLKAVHPKVSHNIIHAEDI